jgi:putative aminopeptidase FrvX
VVIEAHADEISWFVNYISNEGLIYLKRNGGVDHQIAPAKRVVIHGKKGPIKGCLWMASHSYTASRAWIQKNPSRASTIFSWTVARETRKK